MNLKYSIDVGLIVHYIFIYYFDTSYAGISTFRIFFSNDQNIHDETLSDPYEN
jgi:hypothetical protein